MGMELPNRLRIQLLGQFSVAFDGDPVPFDYDKVRAMLAYLAMNPGEAIQRERLATFLWPEASPEASKSGLRQALARLRHSLGVQATEVGFLTVEYNSVQLNQLDEIWIDALEFQDLLQPPADHRHRNELTCSMCMNRRSQACELYQGDFLAWLSIADSNQFEEWAMFHRERLSKLALQAMYQQALYYELRGEISKALSYTFRQLQLNPLDERAHFQQLRLLAASGQRSQAVQHYRNMVSLFEKELGLEPAGEIQEFIAHLKDSPSSLSSEDGSHFTHMRISGLPIPARPLIGRTDELSELLTWLDDPDRRLITITGPGGIGKTRLALAVALHAQRSFLNGVIFIDLARFNSTNAFIPAVFDALQVSLSDTVQSESQLFKALEKQDLLLVLDSFEHVLPAREIITGLWQQTSYLVFLVTSRERLNIPGEWVFTLGGLNVPPSDSPGLPVQDFSAAELFVQSARQVHPEFELTEENRSWVAQICRLVQGMPMAIVLAAAWVRLLSCQEIVAELTSRPGTVKGLDFLSIIARSMPDYSSGVREVFDHSWVMLSETEQRVFRRLAVFRGGFDRQSAQAITGATLEDLLNLTDKSLLFQVDEGRFDCHDLIRQYAFEKMQAAGEYEWAVQSHLDYFLSQAEAREDQWVTQKNLTSFLWFIREQANLWAAFDWAQSEGSNRSAAIAQRLQGLIHQSWYRDGVHRRIWGK